MFKHFLAVAAIAFALAPAIASAATVCTSSMDDQGVVSPTECRDSNYIGPDSVAQPGGPIGDSGQPIVEGDR
jgi:hypothetical protein